MTEITPLYLDLVNYSTALEEQIKYTYQARTKCRAFILGLEHSPVVTLGKRGNITQDLNICREELKVNGVDFFHTDRGGQATLHSPGQLVIYPITPIEQWGISVKDFVCVLQKCIVLSLKEIGIDSHMGNEEPGIFTKEGKIAFCGIRVEQGVSRHGVAVNISNDLTMFNFIRSCGVNNQKIVSIKDYGIKISLSEFYQIWIRHFNKQLLECRKNS